MIYLKICKKCSKIYVGSTIHVSGGGLITIKVVSKGMVMAKVVYCENTCMPIFIRAVMKELKICW